MLPPIATGLQTPNRPHGRHHDPTRRPSHPRPTGPHVDLDALLASDAVLPLVAGLSLRHDSLVLTTRPFPRSGALTKVPSCWQAVGLAVEATTRRSDAHPPVPATPGRLVHLVDRSGRSRTRLDSADRPPWSTTSGVGPHNYLCRSILEFS